MQTQVKDWTPEEIGRLRRQLRFTQAEFGEKCGVHYVTVARWEKGDWKPGLSKLRHLDALAYGLEHPVEESPQ